MLHIKLFVVFLLVAVGVSLPFPGDSDRHRVAAMRNKPKPPMKSPPPEGAHLPAIPGQHSPSNTDLPTSPPHTQHTPQAGSNGGSSHQKDKPHRAVTVRDGVFDLKSVNKPSSQDESFWSKKLFQSAPLGSYDYYESSRRVHFESPTRTSGDSQTHLLGSPSHVGSPTRMSGDSQTHLLGSPSHDGSDLKSTWFDDKKPSGVARLAKSLMAVSKFGRGRHTG